MVTRTGDELGFEPESALERRIAQDSEWLGRVLQPLPRFGSPPVIRLSSHIADVLHNIDLEAPDRHARERLRLIALLHDTFKDDPSPGVSGDYVVHGERARALAERFINDEGVLDVIYVHDEGARAWEIGAVLQDWNEAGRYAQELIEYLQGSLALFIHFWRCDAWTGTRLRDPIRWFEGFLMGRGYELPPQRLPMAVDTW